MHTQINMTSIDCGTLRRLPVGSPWEHLQEFNTVSLYKDATKSLSQNPPIWGFLLSTLEYITWSGIHIREQQSNGLTYYLNPDKPVKKKELPIRVFQCSI